MNCWPFNRQKKAVKLNLYTDRPGVFALAQPLDARKFLPEWWKAIPSSYFDQDKPLIPNTTMKKCAGFIDLYRHGFIIPLWCDLNITIGKKGTADYAYQFSDRVSSMSVHPVKQRGNFLPDTEWQHLKLLVPWYAKCDEEVSFMYCGADYNMESADRWTVAQGIVEYKYQFSLNANLFFQRRDEAYTIQIPAGTPIAHVIPLSERPLEIAHHLVTPFEIDKVTFGDHTPSFVGRYAQRRSMLKQQEANKKPAGKCPFSRFTKD